MDFGSIFDPRKPPKSLKNQWFFNDFGIFGGHCFHCSWKPTWLHFGSILGVKWGPKSIKNRLQTHSNNLSKNDCILDRSWDRFWSIFGPNLAPFWPQVGSKLSQVGSKMAPNLVQNPSWPNFAPTWPNLAPSWPQLGPSWTDFRANLAPTWVQNPTKIGPKSIQEPEDGLQTSPRRPWDRFGWIFVAFLMNDRILDRSWDRFCSIFGPNLAPTWHQVGSKLAPKLA